MGEPEHLAATTTGYRTSQFSDEPIGAGGCLSSYLLGESAEHLMNAGAEQLLDKVHLRYWWFESNPLRRRVCCELGVVATTLGIPLRSCTDQG